MHTRTILFISTCFALVACNSGAIENPPTSQSSSLSSPDVLIETPLANSEVKSPLLVRGKARGTWFFEASLPVQIQDAQGNVIVTVPAQADGEWMTTDYVDFEATVTFTTTAESGFVVIKKDNPSGMPENDDELKIPVSF